MEPKLEKGGIAIGDLSIIVEAAPNEAVAPNAGVVVVLLDETTKGANGFGGLLAPNAKGVLLDVVVPADGKLKPDDDVDKPVPNNDADDIIPILDVVSIGDVDTGGITLGNKDPLVVVVVTENGGARVGTVVVGAVIFDEKANKLGIVAVDDANDRFGAPIPTENRDDFSVEIVDEAVPVVVVVGILKWPNVLDVDDDVVVVTSEGKVEALPVIVVPVDELNNGNVEVVFVLI